MRPEDLVERYYASVYNVAFRALGRREDAEDVAQQTFTRALAHLTELRQPQSARAWLLRIAANIALDELRRRGRQPILTEDQSPIWEDVPDADRLAAPAGALELHELRADVWRAALALPPQQRLALALREMHRMSYAEIADAMNTTVAAVETLLFRARHGFRQAYVATTPPLPTDASCRAIMVLLSASIDGEVDPSEQRRIDSHLRSCPKCQIAAGELRATSRLYALIPFVNPGAAQVSALIGASTASTAAGVGGATIGSGAVVGGSAGAAVAGAAAVGAAAPGALGIGAAGLAALGPVQLVLGAVAALVVTVGVGSSDAWVADASRAPVVDEAVTVRVAEVEPPAVVVVVVETLSPVAELTATPIPSATAPATAVATVEAVTVVAVPTVMAAPTTAVVIEDESEPAPVAAPPPPLARRPAAAPRAVAIATMEPVVPHDEPVGVENEGGAPPKVDSKEPKAEHPPRPPSMAETPPEPGQAKKNDTPEPEAKPEPPGKPEHAVKPSDPDPQGAAKKLESPPAAPPKPEPQGAAKKPESPPAAPAKPEPPGAGKKADAPSAALAKPEPPAATKKADPPAPPKNDAPKNEPPKNDPPAAGKIEPNKNDPPAPGKNEQPPKNEPAPPKNEQPPAAGGQGPAPGGGSQRNSRAP